MANSVRSPVLVGRTREIEILDRALHLAQEGAGGCILIAGEAGIGKSRLAEALSSRAVSARFLILQGYCSEQDNAFPYAPWIEALRAFLAPRSAAEIKEVLGPFAPELVKLIPELSLLIPSLQASLPLEPVAEKHRLFESFARLTTSLASTHPLLIILEDLHWSDEQSLDLLHFLARRIAAAPILILATYRSDDSSPRLANHLAELNRLRLVDEIQLSPLNRSDVSQMMQAILKTESPVSPDWLDLLMPLTEGNPFFVEEMTRSLEEASARPGQWDPFHIPHSIQHTVQPRIEELQERTRQVLSLAAVIGERFEFALLQEITAEDEQSLIRMLKELIAAQLILEQSADQFAFRHALTREVVYAGLMLRERQAMHQLVGETMERLSGEGVDAPVISLAYHFYQAREWQKALEYSQRAGEKALALFAPREALAHFTRALDAARQLSIPAPRSSLFGRARARGVLGDYDGARRDYETILELDRRLEDRHSEWQALNELGLSWQPLDLERAGEYLHRALKLARTLNDAPVLAHSLNRVGNWYYFRGQPRQALRLHREALENFQRLADRRGMAETLGLLGLASYGTGDLVQGAAYYQQAVPLLREVDDRQGLVNTLGYLSLRAHFDTEVWGEVVLSQLADLSEQAVEIAHNINWRAGEGVELDRAGLCWSRAGEYARGLDFLQRAQTLGEEIEHRHLLISVHLILGELYLQLFAVDQAQHNLELAFTTARDVGALLLLGSVLPPLVNACILQKDLPRAKAVMAELSLTEDITKIEAAGVLERRCWSAQAELELALGQPLRALEILDRLIGTAQNIAVYGPHAVPWLSQLRAQALAALSRPEEAAAELLGAQTTARLRGAQPLLWRLHADLGRIFRTMDRRADAEREFSSARAIIQGLAVRIPEGELRENFLQRALAGFPAAHRPTPRQAAKKESGGLTAREREIATLIARGKSNREIADELVISEKTTERHVANILSKLGFNGRTQIAVWIMAKGFDK